MIINTKEKSYKREQYYSYFPTINSTKSKSNKDYLNELDIIMDDIFQRIIKKANARLQLLTKMSSFSASVEELKIYTFLLFYIKVDILTISKWAHF